MANIKLPDFLLTSFQYVGNMATPLSLMVIGIEMTGISLASVRWDRDIIGASSAASWSVRPASW